jgi:type III pantothenate kinase
MILVIDAGNTRLKWGVWAEGAWQGKGSLAITDHLGFGRCLEHIRPGWIGVSCVAGEAVQTALAAALGRFGVPVYWLHATSAGFGVQNGYKIPERLGSDRWANLIACRRLGLAPSVVASLGTAVTLDALTGDGRFLGGMLLPGLGLMRQALQAGTAGVLEVGGSVATFPASTGDGVESGIAAALAGALAQLRGSLAAHEGGEVAVVLTGGDAELLLARVSAPLRLVDDLVLEGLLCVARDLGVQGS